MTKETLERLLGTSLDLLIALEQYADDSTQKDINALFDEVNAEDKGIFSDLEAQDYEVFYENKI